MMGSRGLFKLPWGARQPVEATTAKLQSSERTQRIRVLSAELDVLRAAAFERTRTIETKASYIVVVAGVLASVTGVSLVTTDTWLIGLIPFGFMIAAVIVATIASRPRKLGLPSARTGAAMTKPNSPKPQSVPKPPQRPDVSAVMQTLTHSDNTPMEKR